MDEHRKFLADRLLSEEQPITYRLLSRALDVHVNTAKEMLFDFHQYQNKKKASSVHATYLLCGVKPEEKPTQDGDDAEMMSSMPESEAAEEIPTISLSLVREGDLEKVLSTYTDVSSIHIYSLSPHAQKDLSLLSDINKSLSEYRSKEDLLSSGKKYGTIINPKVKRRDRKGKPNPEAAPILSTAKPAVVKQEPPKTASAAAVKQEPVQDLASSSSAAKPPPSLKKTASGGIMQSFARASSKPLKPKPEPKKEEEHMALSDDGEADDTDLPVKKKEETQDSDATRKSRKEREAELRRMMEASDDEEDEDEEKADEEMEEEAPEPEPEAEPEDPKKQEDPAEVVSSKGDGRRRGRRRVTKKRRIQDEEGYMVTIQEQGWESFSEEETPASSKAATASSTPASSGGAATKGKKAAGKPGQGNIMSFFSKK